MGMDEGSIRKGHTDRVIASDRKRGRPTRVGGGRKGLTLIALW